MAIETPSQPSSRDNTQLFINLSTPSEARTRQTKRIVRSHAARVSAARTSAGPKRSTKTSRTRGTKNPTYLIQINQESTDSESHEDSPDRSWTSSRTPSSGLLTPLMGNAGSIPAAESPIYDKPYLPVVLQNYLQHLAVRIPEIDGPNQQALLRTVWFPVVLHSQAIFQVIVLFSAAHYIAQKPQSAHDLHNQLLYLKAYAIHSINLLIRSDSQGPTDELIAAAGKMASYEAIFGEEADYHAHMLGVKNMVKARGGSSMLGLNGLLARLLLFIDTNSAHLLHTHLYLQDSSLPRREPFQAPNMKRFIGAPTDSG